MSQKHELAAQLLTVLRADLRAAEATLASAAEEVKRLRDEIKAVQPLASSTKLSCDEPDAPAKSESPELRPIFLRAKFTADLVVMFLREHPGATVPDLHSMMVKQGLSVGQPEYFYTVIKKLEKRGLVRRDPSSPLRGGRYYAVEPQSNLVLPTQPKGRSLTN